MHDTEFRFKVRAEAENTVERRAYEYNVTRSVAFFMRYEQWLKKELSIENIVKHCACSV